MSEPGISGKDQVSSKTNPNFQHVNLVVIKCSLVQRRKVLKPCHFITPIFATLNKASLLEALFMDSKLKKEVHKEHCSPSRRQDLNNVDRYVNQPRKIISPFQAFSPADDGGQDGVHSY